MEEKNKKCSFDEHKDIDAVYYCHDCKIYICNKCFNYHKGLLKNHHTYNLDNNEEVFIDICQEKNHTIKLEFYCKNHNKLCCAACIAKLEINGYGQHKDCEICTIENIKEEKKNKLKENIKYLEDLVNSLNNSIKELRILFDKIDGKKEELKTKIQNIFTKIRSTLNEREDELLDEVDNVYKEICNDDIIKECEKLPNKVKLSLDKGNLISNEWNDNNKLVSNLNNCINIEENIKNINLINEMIKKSKSGEETNNEFYIDKECYDNLIKIIKSLGKIYNNFKVDSLILKNKDDFEKFINLISTQIKINGLKILYRASKDGFYINNLKNKINNKSNLIFLFLTGNTRIFGSYIKAKINVEHNTYTKDENAFVFSLNNNKIYKILKPEYSIRYYDGYPVLIGNTGNNNGFYLNGNEIYDSQLLNTPKIYDFQKNNELTERDKKFIEFEIFEIIS